MWACNRQSRRRTYLGRRHDQHRPRVRGVHWLYVAGRFTTYTINRPDFPILERLFLLDTREGTPRRIAMGCPRKDQTVGSDFGLSPYGGLAWICSGILPDGSARIEVHKRDTCGRVTLATGSVGHEAPALLHVREEGSAGQPSTPFDWSTANGAHEAALEHLPERC